MGRILIIIGIVLVVLGLLLTYSSFLSYLKVGRLPGDLSIKRENFSFFFPITTCIVISVILSLLLYLFRK